MILRPYQEDCIDAAFKAWKEYRTILCCLATSAGKTVIASKIIEMVQPRKALFLCDSEELVYQPVKSLRNMGMIASIEKAEHRANLEWPIVVGSVQTMAKKHRLERFPVDHFQYVLVDEIHRNAKLDQKVKDRFPNARVLGITATPFTSKKKDLSDYYEHVAYDLGTFDLIKEGYIPPIEVLTLPIEIDITDVHSRGENFDEEEMGNKITPYYEAIADAVLEHARDRKTIAYLPLIKSSIDFVQVCRRKGINAIHVDGKSDDREEILQRFREGRIQLLSNSTVLSTGVDLPIADCLLNLSPTRSIGLYQQRVGRVIRVLPNVVEGLQTAEERRKAISVSKKPNALILDVLWQYQELGLARPSSLIAKSEEEADEIGKRIKDSRTQVDLEEVSRQVQAEKEEILRKALERNARRKGSLMDAMQLALLTHDQKLITYEPISKWEYLPVSSKQKELLHRFGVDADTVQSKGHASAMINTMFKRRSMKLATFKQLKWLNHFGVENAQEKTFEEATQILSTFFAEKA